MKFTYLLIEFFTIIICFIASFHSKIKFYKHFGSFLISSAIVATPFIIWDVIFTAKGVWWFNLNYTTALVIAGLPIEEWLFFFCIPFACVFTFFCFEKFNLLKNVSVLNNVIVFVCFIFLTVASLLFYQKSYTIVTSVFTLCTLLYLHFIAKIEWLGKATIVYFILMPGFFAVNGVLTGSGIEHPIVNYNSNEFLNVRMFTIPVEDAVYGYSQFLLNVYFFKLIRRYNERRNSDILVQARFKA